VAHKIPDVVIIVCIALLCEANRASCRKGEISLTGFLS